MPAGFPFGSMGYASSGPEETLVTSGHPLPALHSLHAASRLTKCQTHIFNNSVRKGHRAVCLTRVWTPLRNKGMWATGMDKSKSHQILHPNSPFQYNMDFTYIKSLCPRSRYVVGCHMHKDTEVQKNWVHFLRSHLLAESGSNLGPSKTEFGVFSSCICPKGPRANPSPLVGSRNLMLLAFRLCFPYQLCGTGGRLIMSLTADCLGKWREAGTV